MIYQEYLDNTTSRWLMADGGGQTPLDPNCAAQTPGKPMKLALDPKGKPYMDPYWYLKLGALNPTTILYEISLQYPTVQDLKRSQAFECETDMINNNVHFDTGVQGDFNSGFWRYYDFSLGKNGEWVSTNVGLPAAIRWTDGFTMIVVCTVGPQNPYRPSWMTRNGVTFQGIYVDGQWYGFGKFAPAVKKVAPNHFNQALQIDGNGSGDAYSVLISKANLRMF